MKEIWGEDFPAKLSNFSRRQVCSVREYVIAMKNDVFLLQAFVSNCTSHFLGASEGSELH
jgi:hypothetical protein